MAIFLHHLAQHQNVKAAAEAVGMSRSSAYHLRQRLVGQPFDIAWEAAFEHGLGSLAHIALERAIHGVEVPHYYQGELVGTHRRYSDRLLTYLLTQPGHRLGRLSIEREFGTTEWQRLLDRVQNGAPHWTHDAADDALMADLEAFTKDRSVHAHAHRLDTERHLQQTREVNLPPRPRPIHFYDPNAWRPG